LTPSQNLRYPHRIYAIFPMKLHPSEKKVPQIVLESSGCFALQEGCRGLLLISMVGEKCRMLNFLMR
jgi:hypothetical protein